MIPLGLAMELKKAGLIWQTNNYDFFAIPDRGMDDRVFILADMIAYTELIQGWPAVTFHGSAEWALDYIFTHEIVWLPTEEQLREALWAMLPPARPGEGRLTLSDRDLGYRCVITLDGVTLAFNAPTAGEAYGRAVLHMLKLQPASNGV